MRLNPSQIPEEIMLRQRGRCSTAVVAARKALPATVAAVGLSVLLAACGGGADTLGEVKTAAAEVVQPTESTAAAATLAAASATSTKELIAAKLNAKKPLVAASPVASITALNGWYYNPLEGGTGFMFEVQGNRAFVAFFMYEEGSGKPVWYSADGAFAANGDGSHSFSGDLRYYTNGQPVTSPTYSTPTSVSIGTAQMRFSGAGVAVQLPGRTIAATRFDFNGLGSTPSAAQPEVGWYWNPAEGGRGYGVEVQNNKLFMAMFHYNEDGTPTWNVMSGNLTAGVASNSFLLYSGGQSMASAYRTPAMVELGSFTLSFRNRCAGQVQRAGVAAVSIRRFFFGDNIPGAECHSVADGMPDVAGLAVGLPVQMQPGDAVFGNIDFAGDVDAFGIALQANTRYQFDLKGYTTNNGTLWDPMLALYDSSLNKLAENDDGTSEDLDSRIVFTPTATGTYYLAARAFEGLTGSFVLTASGVAQGLSAQPVPTVASYAGNMAGAYAGRARGSLAIRIDNAGVATGTVAIAGQASPVQLSGSVAFGGVVRLTTLTSSGTTTFVGYLGPDGDLAGTWFDAVGPGGTFTAMRVRS